MLQFLQYNETPTILLEGRFDPGILKCVFMSGGPGSGKSFVAGELFGITPAFKSSFSHFGLKSVNSDNAFEFLLMKHGIDPADLAKDEVIFHTATVGPDSPRERAKHLTRSQLDAYFSGKLGIIRDGTGDDTQKIATQKAQAESHGYDCYMVFVNTSLETALRRNASRPRKLPDYLVQQIWTKTQSNLDNFSHMFGQNFVVIDNEDASDTEIRALAAKCVKRFIQEPVKNVLGRNWIANLDAIAAQVKK